MKMRKKLAALLAAAMIASVMPMSAFAASDNRVSHSISLEKDQSTTAVTAPIMEVKLKDALTTGTAFYLNLDGAKWDTEANVQAGVKEAGNPATLEVTRSSDKTLRVVADKNYGATTVFTFQLLAKVTGAEATIEIDGEGTTVSNMEKKVFATSSSNAASKVVVADPSNFSETGSLAKITFKEPFQGAYAGKTATERTVTIELRDNDFEFVIDTTAGAGKGSRITGQRGFTGTEVKITNANLNPDKDELTIVLPTVANAARGEFEIDGLKVRAKRGATKGEVKAIVRGDLVDGSQEIIVAKHSDFATKLEMTKEYEVQTGKTVEVEFALSEEIADSLLRNRSVTFNLSKGAKFQTGSVKVKANDNADDYQTEATLTVDSKDNYNSFTMTGLQPKATKKAKYTFKATLLVPNNFDGDELILTAEGKALSDVHEVVAAKVKKAVDVEVTPMDVKVGLQKQVGGKIVIKESEKESILRSYKDVANNTISPANIIITIGDESNYTDGLRITDADIKVTEGDLVLDLDEKVVSGGVITIPVKRQSTVPSTIEITNVEVTANRNVPEGKYNIKVGGSALSKNTKLVEFTTDRALRNDITDYGLSTAEYLDAMLAVEFINITTKNTEDNTGATTAKVNFVVGSDKYLVNGVEETMDVAAFVKDGRTMVPVRYVAAALGVKAEQVIWDGVNQTATVLADKTIQVKLGSKMMIVDGVSIPMIAAAELVSDRTFVPVAEIARALNVPVEWNAETQTATFN